jgi:hypothetical protein
MGKIAKLVFLLALLGSAGWSDPVSSRQLIGHSRDFDGKPVEFKGELIGEPMRRGDHLWLNVSDGDSAIGVWVLRSVVPAVRYFGVYSVRGDTVLVYGLFHRNCPEHGGDMDIHAESITIVAPGETVSHLLKPAAMAWASGLCALALIAFLFWRRRERFLGRT